MQGGTIFLNIFFGSGVTYYQMNCKFELKKSSVKGQVIVEKEH